MNNELHHKWNATREVDRGSGKDAPEIPTDLTEKNKVKLKQNKPR